MARTAAGQTSKSSIFRGYYQQRPDLLDIKGYAEVFQMYLADNPGKEIGAKERQIVANVKSAELRKRGTKKGPAGKPGRKPKAASAIASTSKSYTSSDALDTLETAILDSIRQAKELDSGSLAEVIHYLRKARYQLILKIEGE